MQLEIFLGHLWLFECCDGNSVLRASPCREMVTVTTGC